MAPKDPQPLDELDEQIVWELGKDGRIPNSRLASKLGIAESTTHARVKSLIDRGVIQSFHAALDMDLLGLPFQAMIMVRLRTPPPTDLLAYAREFALLPPVIALFVVGSSYDFMIHVACATREQLRDLVAQKIAAEPGVASVQTHLVFDHLRGEQHMDHLSGLGDVLRPA